jgi:hypothetical protein
LLKAVRHAVIVEVKSGMSKYKPKKRKLSKRKSKMTVVAPLE